MKNSIKHVSNQLKTKQQIFFKIFFIFTALATSLVLPCQVHAFGVSPGRIEIGPATTNTLSDFTLTISRGSTAGIKGILIHPEGRGSKALSVATAYLPLNEAMDTVKTNIGFIPKNLIPGTYSPYLTITPSFTQTLTIAGSAIIPSLRIPVTFEVLDSEKMLIESPLITIRSDNAGAVSILSRVQNKGTRPITIEGFGFLANEYLEFSFPKKIIIPAKKTLLLESNTLKKTKFYTTDSSAKFYWNTTEGKYFSTTSIHEIFLEEFSAPNKKLPPRLVLLFLNTSAILLFASGSAIILLKIKKKYF